MRIEGRLDRYPQDDRRATVRRELRLRAASVAGENAAANVFVLDLSQTGLLLETAAQMATGESFQIDLPHAGPQAAEVVWTSGNYVGCRFERPIGAAAVSAAQLRSEPAATVGPISRAALDEGSDPDDSFGTRLRRLRKQYNLSQSALAKLLGVTKLSVWKWERGDVRPRPATAAALARLFALGEGDLLLSPPARDFAPSREPAPERGTGDELARFVDACKTAIADRFGTTADKVEISVRL